MTSRRSLVDVTYDDPRSGDRIRERRMQEVPWNEVDDIRDREIRALRRRQDYAYDDNALVPVPRREGYDGGYRVRPRRSGDDGHRYSEMQQAYRDATAYDDRHLDVEDDKDEGDGDDRRRRYRRHKHRRSNSEHVNRSDKRAVEKNMEREEDEENLLWYSMKQRGEGNFFERNFDVSYDGIIAAAAGAAIGAITVREFGGEGQNKALKTLGGAVAGATAFNAVENRYRMFIYEKEERKERKEKRRQEG